MASHPPLPTQPRRPRSLEPLTWQETANNVGLRWGPGGWPLPGGCWTESGHQKLCGQERPAGEGSREHPGTQSLS